jgi:hypothetical protein
MHSVLALEPSWCDVKHTHMRTKYVTICTSGEYMQEIGPGQDRSSNVRSNLLTTVKILLTFVAIHSRNNTLALSLVTIHYNKPVFMQGKMYGVNSNGANTPRLAARASNNMFVFY